MSRIFSSHSSRDNFQAVALRDWLAEQGWSDVFLDLDAERGIAAGDRWERALHQAALRCEAVISLVSASWLTSGWCNHEFALARKLDKNLLATLSQDGLRRLKRGLERAGLDPKFFAWPPPGEPERAPYRGLKPLESIDAGIFFGRDPPIVEATDRLRGLGEAAAPRLLVLLGASGAGKSSFLRAGLMPRLAREDSRFLPLPVIRPERAALFGDSGLLGMLAAALPDRRRAELRAAIRAGAAGIRPLLRHLVEAAFARTLADAPAVKPPTLVIAVDQAEELLRAEEGVALLAVLRDLASADDPAVIVVFAIRSDGYDELQHAKPLEGVPHSLLSLSPMPRSAHGEVIEGPARRSVEAGGRLAVEPRLTARLLEDIEKGAGSDALPLLAFTLELAKPGDN
jgi:hypothetical protein